MNKLITQIKNSWRSWTIWLNGLALALLEFVPDIIAYLPSMQDSLDENFYKTAFKWLLIINLFLRFKTKQDLAAKGK